MKNHDACVGLIHSTVLAFALGLGGAVVVAADEESNPSPPSDQPVLERAVPQGARCAITTYYSDAAMTKQVGTFSTCPGPKPKKGLTGKKTKYFETDTIPLGNPGQGKPGSPGSLPCEFLKEGCGNLPTQHH